MRPKRRGYTRRWEDTLSSQWIVKQFAWIYCPGSRSWFGNVDRTRRSRDPLGRIATDEACRRFCFTDFDERREKQCGEEVQE